MSKSVAIILEVNEHDDEAIKAFDSWVSALTEVASQTLYDVQVISNPTIKSGPTIIRDLPTEKKTNLSFDDLYTLSVGTLKDMKSDLEAYLRDLIKDVSKAGDEIRRVLNLIEEIEQVLSEK